VGGFFGLDHKLQQGALGEASQVGFSRPKSNGVEAVAKGVALGHGVSLEKSRFVQCATHARDLSFISASVLRDGLDS
jgi:hypothetical protein